MTSTSITLEAITMRQLLQVLQIIMDGDRQEITVTIFATFVGVALYGFNRSKGEDPLTFKELSTKIGLPYTSVSRHLRYLGEWERYEKPGYGLVKTEVWVRNQRQKLVYLTPKGERLAARIIETLAPAPHRRDL